MKARDLEGDLMHADVLARLSYCPESGFFHWRNEPPVRGQVRGTRAGRQRLDGYRDISVLKTRVLEHRLAFFYMTGRWPTEQIDHANGDRSDNRFLNLREASKQENMWNTNGHSRRLYPARVGVQFRPKAIARPWLARIRYKGKVINLGHFETEAEAAAARKAAEVRLFGEFAGSAR